MIEKKEMPSVGEIDAALETIKKVCEANISNDCIDCDFLDISKDVCCINAIQPNEWKKIVEPRSEGNERD